MTLCPSIPDNQENNNVLPDSQLCLLNAKLSLLEGQAQTSDISKLMGLLHKFVKKKNTHKSMGRKNPI